MWFKCCDLGLVLVWVPTICGLGFGGFGVWFFGFGFWRFVGVCRFCGFGVNCAA